MSEIISIKNPELLWLRQENHIYYGGNQSWYPTTWQQRSGCGPTACAHLIWYLAQTRPNYSVLCGYDIKDLKDFLKLMEDIWEYVTPGNMGVNNTSIFIRGALRYAAGRGITLTADTLDIARNPAARPNMEQVISFMQKAFKNDSPIAFLNLSNGKLTNLESWHWVTIISIDIQNYTAVILDQGERKEINMMKWLKTSLLGGGLVVIT